MKSWLIVDEFEWMNIMYEKWIDLDVLGDK